MLYQDFKETICKKVQDMFGDEVKITIQQVEKNNGVSYDGMTILSPDLNVAPTIYLNYYFEKYEGGQTIDDICKDIVAVYKKNCPTEKMDISFFMDWNKVKSRIVFKLINYELNKKMLETTPHYRFLDMAIVFICHVESYSIGFASILIHNSHLKIWNVEVDELYSVAAENTPSLLEASITNMSCVLKDLLGEESTEMAMVMNAEPMYILTNKYKMHGSTCMVYENLIIDFANSINSDLYILPSSVHECILIPVHYNDDKKATYQMFTDMVKEVNDSQLQKEEILSNHAYYYSRTAGQILSHVENI